jgi:hypothetical protein
MSPTPTEPTNWAMELGGFSLRQKLGSALFGILKVTGLLLGLPVAGDSSRRGGFNQIDCARCLGFR